MDLVITFLKNPITIASLIGLGAGLILSLIILIKTRLYRKELEDEIADTRYDYRRLEEQLNTQMRVSAKAQEELQTQLDQKQSKLKNLETTVQTLSTKPGKKELRELHLYEKTLEQLQEESPNAMLAWENAKNKAMESITDIDKGLKPMLRKVFKQD